MPRGSHGLSEVYRLRRVAEDPGVAGLREENRRLMDRIRELETAATSSTPSLYTSSPSYSSSSPTSEHSETHQSLQEETLTALGTLAIGDHGQSSHHNQAASAEVRVSSPFHLLMAEIQTLVPVRCGWFIAILTLGVTS